MHVGRNLLVKMGVLLIQAKKMRCLQQHSSGVQPADVVVVSGGVSGLMQRVTPEGPFVVAAVAGLWAGRDELGKFANAEVRMMVWLQWW